MTRLQRGGLRNRSIFNSCKALTSQVKYWRSLLGLQVEEFHRTVVHGLNELSEPWKIGTFNLAAEQLTF